MNTNKKKRKRTNRSQSEDEREIIELQIDRYDRLIYTARKHLHKSAKQVKTFILQKEIRKRSNKSAERTSTTKGLDDKKNLDLDVVTCQAIRQLGLYHCNPRFKMTTEETDECETGVVDETEVDDENLENKGGDDNDNHKKKRQSVKKKKNEKGPSVIPNPLAPDDPQKPLVDAVLAHKRFSKSLEEWNEKVTEYRRWCMKIEQRNKPNPFGMVDDFVVSKRSKKNKNKKQKEGSASNIDGGLQATIENDTSLFCTLGGASPDDGNGPDEFNRYSQYGPASDFGDAPKRKNRKGQRQRRAKALAIEAKKQGRSHEYYQSANWREPKPKEDSNENSNDKVHRKSRGRGRETNRNQRLKQEYQNENHDNSSSQLSKQSQEQQEKQHPSWAAKQAQSTGIVAFKGTKITFWQERFE